MIRNRNEKTLAAERIAADNLKVNVTDIVNDDTTGGENVPASAEIVKTHRTEIDANSQSISELTVQVTELQNTGVDTVARESITQLADYSPVGKNLCDKSKRTQNVTMSSSSGDTITTSNYDLYDYISVEAGVAYVISPSIRHFLLFNTAKIAVAGTYISTLTSNYSFTPSADGYARFDASNANVETQMMEVGSTPTRYYPYGYNCKVGEKANKLTVQITNSGVNASIVEDVNGKPLVTAISNNGSLNGSFRFESIKFGDSAIVSSGLYNDDITPIRTQMGTIGGNHGFTCVRKFTNPDVKDTSDLGSVWTDGTREYVLMAIVDEGVNIVMGGSYTGTPITSDTVSPSANLTHVSDATHTGAIDYTTIVAGSSSGNMYPCIARGSVNYYLDGNILTADGTYMGDEFKVCESYEILDYADLYDKCKANIGSAYTVLDIDGAVLVQNTFK